MNIASHPHKSIRFKGKLHLIGLLILTVLIFSNIHSSSSFTDLTERLSYTSRNVPPNAISSYSNSSSRYAYQLNLDFNTFVGPGTSQSMTVDAKGNSYITGYKSGQLFFHTKNAYNSIYGGGEEDAIIAKFSPNGSLLFSSYFGGNGSDYGYSIAADSSGNSYITGYTDSSNFPLKNAYNTTYSKNGDIFIAKFNATGSLIFSMLFGTNESVVNSLAIDNADNIYITGLASLPSFPLKNAFNKTYIPGSGEVFVAKFNATGYLLYSTFLGTTFNINDFHPPSITVDRSGNCYITGNTYPQNFPATLEYIKTPISTSDIFVTKLNSTGSLVFSTMLGGSNYDYSTAIALTRNGNTLVTGRTDSSDFPLKNAYNKTYGGFGDAFIVKLNSTGHLMFSTYLGGSDTDIGTGIAIDSTSNYFVIGTPSYNFPIKNSYNNTITGNAGFIVEYNSTGYLFLSMLVKSGLSSIAIDSSNNIYITRSGIDNAFQVNLYKYYPPLKVLVNTTQPSILQPIFLFLTSPLVDAPVLGGFIIALVFIFEFYSYVQDKRKAEADQNKSFITYLKENFTIQRKRKESKDLISAKTFELLDEIEQENKEEK